MALLTANGVGVIGASIVMPLYGCWTADLLLDNPDLTGFDAGAAVTIRCDGGLEFSGVVVPDRSGDFLDSTHVRVIAGKGGMSKAATVQGYVQPGARVQDVLSQLANDGGESLSSDIDPSLLSQNLNAWATLAGTVAAGVKQLIDIVVPAANWRFTADGKLLVVTDSWPTSSDGYDLLHKDPAQRQFMLAVDTFTVVPGVDLDGVGRVNRVEHVLEGAAVRSTVWTQVADEDRGIAGSIQSLARQELTRVDFLGKYDAKVVKQSSDGTKCDLEPADARIPKMRDVPIRNGVANTVCKVAPGTTLRLGWDSGNPQYPYCEAWQGGETIQEINFAQGQKGAVRVDDTLTSSTALATWAGQVEGFINGLVPGTVLPLFAAGPGLPDQLGKVSQGSTKVKVG